MKSLNNRRRSELCRLAASTGSLCRRALTVALLLALEFPAPAQDTPGTNVPSASEPTPAAAAPSPTELPPSPAPVEPTAVPATPKPPAATPASAASAAPAAGSSASIPGEPPNAEGEKLGARAPAPGTVPVAPPPAAEGAPAKAAPAPAKPEEAAKPAGAPKADGDAPSVSPKVDVAGSETKIETIVAMINQQIPNKLNIYGKVSGQRVNVLADGQPVEDVLSSIANPNGWVWWKEKNGDYGLGDKDYYEKNVLIGMVVQKVFRPNNIKASELDRAIKGLLTPNTGSSVADDRTNKLIVNDLPSTLERIERFIREIDVQLIVRVFYVRHADVEDIAKKVESYKSGPGTIEVDKKTHQIIVTDLLSNIKKMELLIDILDVGPEIVIYDINNVGIEGKGLEDLQKIIDTIRTKDLLFEVNEKQGVMILEDVPEVHERVESILAEFDKPVRQVLLQAEIVSTNFSRELSFGVSKAAFGEDLLSASAQGALPTGAGIGGPATGYTDFRSAFPNVGMAGKTITGTYLSRHALIELKSVYSDTSSRVLLQPRLLVKNQETSEIRVGKEVPYVTTFTDNNNNNNNNNNTTTTTQSTVPSGLKFEATPSIANSYLIELELKIDNDSAARTEPIDGRTLVEKDNQNVKTTLQIPSGRTRIIGGLIKNTDSDGSSGVPLLASIPYLGSLFGVKSSSRNATNLMIFITPSIVEDDEVRQTTPDGRRGRSASNDSRLPGQYDLQLGAENAADESEDVIDPANPGEMLSGDSNEEDAALKRSRDLMKKREAAAAEERASNYVPGRNVGSTSLNTNAPAGSPGQPRTANPAAYVRPNSTTTGQPTMITTNQNQQIPPPPQRETSY